jgi:hypothetical protein
MTPEERIESLRAQIAELIAAAVAEVGGLTYPQLDMWWDRISEAANEALGRGWTHDA